MRSTYKLVDFMGDIGGFSKALKIIFEVAIFPIISFKYAGFQMTQIFKQKQERTKAGSLLSSSKVTELGQLKQGIMIQSKIEIMTFLSYYCLRCCGKNSSQRKDYKMKLKKAKKQLANELDLK